MSYTTFGFTGRNLTDYQNNIRKQLDKFNKIVESHDKTPEEIQIVNSNKENIWFKNNVQIVFIQGITFTEDDTAMINDVLDCFDDKENGLPYLANQLKLLHYEEPESIQLENMLEVGHGNYHILMVPIVLNTVGATEDAFKRLGPVFKYVGWEEVVGIMSVFNSKYSLISQYNQRTRRMCPTKIDERTITNERFRMDGTLDQEQMDSINRNLDEKRIASDPVLGTRIRGRGEYHISENVKIKSTTDLRNTNTLENRIREENTIDTSIISEKRGVELRINDWNMPKRKTTYKLYDDITDRTRMK
jgi:hypothetical protein